MGLRGRRGGVGEVWAHPRSLEASLGSLSVMGMLKTREWMHFVLLTLPSRDVQEGGRGADRE